jgi:hypothetical protein
VRLGYMMHSSLRSSSFADFYYARYRLGAIIPRSVGHRRACLLSVQHQHKPKLRSVIETNADEAGTGHVFISKCRWKRERRAEFGRTYLSDIRQA